jgi:antitoxin (DNA-binding transcriptional repressor) of toxin-antitoxin stability system
MTRIDLDDLPPRLARLLSDLKAGDELLLVQGGALVSRLTIAGVEDGATPDPAGETDMAEVLEHFKAMIEEEF